MHRSVKEKHIKLGARKRLNHFLLCDGIANRGVQRRNTREMWAPATPPRKTGKKYPLISAHLPVRVLRNERQELHWQLDPLSEFCCSASIPRSTPSEKGSFIRNLWAACKWDGGGCKSAQTAKRVTLCTLHTAFFHTLRIKRWARTYLVSVHIPTYTKERAVNLSLFFKAATHLFL